MDVSSGPETRQAASRFGHQRMLVISTKWNRCNMCVGLERGGGGGGGGGTHTWPCVCCGRKVACMSVAILLAGESARDALTAVVLGALRPPSVTIQACRV